MTDSEVRLYVMGIGPDDRALSDDGVRALLWAIDVGRMLTPLEGDVLEAVAREQGRLWPGKGESALAKECGRTYPNVRKALARLEGAGVIYREEVEGQGTAFFVSKDWEKNLLGENAGERRLAPGEEEK